MACISPWYVKSKLTTEKTPVPCGKCPECLKRVVNSWAFRLSVEQRSAITSLFVTLTYATTNMPFHGENPTLQKTDLQKFFKRLRKLNPEVKLKYFAVGEYGTKKNRPHYHAVIFNANPHTIERAWALDNKRIGEVHIGQVTESSIVYTLKYMCKHGRIDPKELAPEFRLMSKGMGEAYVVRMKKWHNQDILNRTYIPLKDGKKISMPRYYKDRIYRNEDRKMISFWHEKQLEKREEELRNEHGEQYEKWDMDRKNAIIEKFNYRNNKRQKL
jgi:hypothetical protein